MAALELASRSGRIATEFSGAPVSRLRAKADALLDTLSERFSARRVGETKGRTVYQIALDKNEQAKTRRTAGVIAAAGVIMTALTACDFGVSGGEAPVLDGGGAGTDGGTPVAPPTQSQGGDFADYYQYCKEVAYQNYNDAVTAANGTPTPQTQENFYGPEADCQADFYDVPPQK